MKPGWKNDILARMYFEGKRREQKEHVRQRSQVEAQMQAIDMLAEQILQKAQIDATHNNEPRH